MSTTISIVYFGTPAYAEPALRDLAGDDRFDIRLVVTQPDRPAGRGHRLLAPAVKVVAEELGLPVYQPETLRDEQSRAPLVEADADVFVVAAYGLIFGPKTLATPRRGCLNLHASILPAYRGAAPIPAAILRGDAETGVTLMEMERGLDTGPIVDFATTQIRTDDTSATLTHRLASIGGQLVIDSLPRWFTGELTARPQPAGATTVRLLTKADGAVDWTRPALEIERHVRAMWPWPRAWTTVDGANVQIHSVRRSGWPVCTAGDFGLADREVEVCTGDGGIVLETIQVPGARAMSAYEAVRRKLLKTGGSFEPAPKREPLVKPA